MGYTELTTIVEGALESTQTFTDEQDEQMDNSIEATKQFARDNSDMDVQIYKLHHDHEQSECECIQFLTDYSPYWSSK